MSSRKKTRRPSLKGSLNPSKRHRDRVNVELDNLAKLLPFPPEVITKLDKLSVLRLSASYLRTKHFFKGLNSTEKSNGSSLSTTLDDVEKNGKLKDMMLEALDGFLMVLTQEGELFYASETISDFLGVSQPSVIHQDFLRFVHADDHNVLMNNLKLVPTPPEQKICELPDDDEKTKEEEDDISDTGSEPSRERSFVCRFKCILNTNAGFYKPFQCHGRLREMDQPDVDVPQLALFLMCSPVEITTSILEVRMKSMLFSTKNKLDLTFVDIDQKGKQIVGYTKKDISAQSSYCMMHYDDIPILKKMHQDLLETGKCEGTFRWLNKQMRWQWLSGSGQVILKNNQPDFVITTNKPLTDEEGDEEVRRRERELGIVPTSPATMLTHLQITDLPSRSTNASFDRIPSVENNQSRLTTGMSASTHDGANPPPSTSCASAGGLLPDDMTWDFDADSLFEASGTSWDTAHASLADLDGIGKGDLVGELFHLDVHDLNFEQDLGKTEPLKPSPAGSCAVNEYPSTFPQPPNHVTSSRAAAWSPSQQNRPMAVTSPTQQQFAPLSCALSPGNQHRPVNNPCSLNPPAATTISPSSAGAPHSTSGYRASTVSPGAGSPLRHPPNGPPPTSGYLSHADMMNGPNSAQSGPGRGLSFATNVAVQNGLLRVQTEQGPIHPIKTEPGRTDSFGYYCNSAAMGQLPMSDMSRMAGLSAAQTNPNGARYQNRYAHQGNFPGWTPAPPSPYSSGSSSSGSYADALNVQFSPTEVLSSPFASPTDDNDYSGGHINGPVNGPSPTGQYYPAGNYRIVQQRSRPRAPNTFAQPFVNIPEISPMGLVEELVPGAHRVSPVAVHNGGLTNW